MRINHDHVNEKSCKVDHKDNVENQEKNNKVRKWRRIDEDEERDKGIQEDDDGRKVQEDVGQYDTMNEIGCGF